MSCPASLCEMLLKFEGALPKDSTVLQDADPGGGGGFSNFLGKPLAGGHTLRRIAQLNAWEFPLATIRQKLAANVPVGIFLNIPGRVHGWLIDGIRANAGREEEIHLVSKYSEDGSGCGRKTVTETIKLKDATNHRWSDAVFLEKLPVVLGNLDGGDAEMKETIASEIAELLNKQNQLMVKYDSQRVKNDAGNYVFRLGDDGHVIGVVEVKKVQWYQCEIRHLSVGKKRLGVGTWLLGQALAQAKILGTQVAQCTIRAGNIESEGFFRANGFIATATFRNQESGNDVTVYQKVLVHPGP